MRSDPGERYQSASELRSDLNAILTQPVTEVRPTEDGFQVETTGATVSAQRVVLAIGDMHFYKAKFLHLMSTRYRYQVLKNLPKLQGRAKIGALMNMTWSGNPGASSERARAAFDEVPARCCP